MKHDESLCAEIEASLPLYVGADLEAKALAEVREHLGACPRCAERALAARAARRELVVALRLAGGTGPDLWSGVRAALAEEGAIGPAARAAGTPRRAAATVLRWHDWRILTAAAAAIVAGFWAGLRFAAEPDVERDHVSPPLVVEGDRAPGIPIGAPAEGAADPALAAGGLRRLRPDEARLRDGAVIYVDLHTLDSLPTPGPVGVHPVSTLRPVPTGAPRW